MEELPNPKLRHIESNIVIDISQSPFLIGRALHCQYVIASEVISRVHCKLESQGNKWMLMDQSRNGTYVNGILVKTDGVYLNNEDKIKLCPEGHTYMFLLPSSPSIHTVRPSVPNNRSVTTFGTNTTTTSPTALPDDVAELFNSDWELDAVLSALASPSQAAGSSSNCIAKATVQSSSNPQIRNTDPIPSTSNIRKSPSFTDAPSNKRSKIRNETNAENAESAKHVESLSTCNESQDNKLKKEISCQQQEQIEEMEDEMQCSICSEMFVKATTLNCAHSFCKYCIETWRKTRNICPICRTKIISSNATLVLDNVIEKVIRNASDEVKQRRQELLAERKKLEEPKAPAINQNHHNRGRGGNRGRRGRGNSNVNRGRNYNNGRNQNGPFPMPALPPPPPIIELESSSESDSDVSSDSNTTDSDGWREEYENDEWEPGIPGAYYGGYGHCYSCGRSGHWANGCPFS